VIFAVTVKYWVDYLLYLHTDIHYYKYVGILPDFFPDKTVTVTYYVHLHIFFQVFYLNFFQDEIVTSYQIGPGCAISVSKVVLLLKNFQTPYLEFVTPWLPHFPGNLKKIHV
jgi:hypothetical protein